MSEEVSDAWACWRLIVERIATFEELNNGSWSFEDVMDANEALDGYEDAKTEAQRRAQAKQSKA